MGQPSASADAAEIQKAVAINQKPPVLACGNSFGAECDILFNINNVWHLDRQSAFINQTGSKLPNYRPQTLERQSKNTYTYQFVINL